MNLQEVTRHKGYSFIHIPKSFDPHDDILKYLDGGLTRAQTIENVALPIEKAYDDDTRGDHSLAYRLLGHLWRAFNSFTSQIPHKYDVHQRRLADLLHAIRRRETNECRQIENDYGRLARLWTDLPLYDPAVYGQWDSPSMIVSSVQKRRVDIEHDTLNRDLGGPSKLRDDHTNTNAFLAHLVGLESDNEDWWVRALCTFCWALEYEYDESDNDSLSLNVPGAAVWILYAGELVWENEMVWGHPPSDRLAYSTASTPRWAQPKKNGFCDERWSLWKDQFRVVADTEGISAEARDLAQRAAEKMGWIESNVVRQ